MARKRMFDLEVVDTDLFLEMPQSTQNLYFHLGMRADDDGFVSNPKKIIRTIGANEDDLKILFSKQFIIPFESGIVVIRHWKLNNYLRKDRHTDTIYKEEMKQLIEDENGIYNLNKNIGIPSGNQTETTGLHSKEKKSIEEYSIEKSSIDNCKENDSCVDDFQKVIDFYDNNIGLLTPYGLSVLESYKTEFSEDVIIYAMQKSVEANKRTIQYIKAILNNWNKQGIKSLVEAQEEAQSFRKTKEKEGGQVIGSTNRNNGKYQKIDLSANRAREADGEIDDTGLI